MMKTIGLTGGICSGKSTAARFLEDLGAVIIDADKIGHEVLETDTEVWRKVVDTFGRQVLTSGGSIDRRKLGEIVFGSPESLLKLNQITHPRIYQVAKTRLEDCRKRGASVVVLEAPLLLKAGWTSLVDEVWVTTASEATVLRRLQERRGLSITESLARTRSQMPVQEQINCAGVIIDTDCNLEELKARVEELWQGLDE
jgi:dephospho-CoA kinase